MHKSSKHPSLLGFRSALRGANLHYLANVFEFRRHQAHRRNSRPTHYIDGPGDDAKFDGAVSTDKSNAAGPHLENLLKPALEIFPLHRVLVDSQRPIAEDLHNNHIRRRRRLALGFRLLGQIRRKTILHLRDTPHKYDQKHQQNIDQRNHIHFRNRSELWTARRNSHESPRTKKIPPRGGLSPPAPAETRPP